MHIRDQDVELDEEYAFPLVVELLYLHDAYLIIVGVT
jgi:hypothetical protein